MIRLGLCGIFRDAPVKFRTTTATAIKRLSPDEGRGKEVASYLWTTSPHRFTGYLIAADTRASSLRSSMAAVAVISA